MSWWTDIRDTIVGIVTAPVRIPVQLFSDIIHGKNVFDSVGKAVVGSVAATNPLFQTLSVAKAVAPGAVHAAGFIPGLEQAATASQQINASGANKQNSLELLAGTGKLGLIAAGGAAYGLTGAVAGKALASGDIKGALSSGVGSTLVGDVIPQELVDSSREAVDLARQIATRPQSAPVVNVAPARSTTTALQPVTQGGPSPLQIGAIAAAVVVGLVIARRK